MIGDIHYVERTDSSSSRNAPSKYFGRGFVPERLYRSKGDRSLRTGLRAMVGLMLDGGCSFQRRHSEAIANLIGHLIQT